jgi:hypothetical protein
LRLCPQPFFYRAISYSRAWLLYQLVVTCALLSCRIGLHLPLGSSYSAPSTHSLLVSPHLAAVSSFGHMACLSWSSSSFHAHCMPLIGFIFITALGLVVQANLIFHSNSGSALHSDTLLALTLYSHHSGHVVRLSWLTNKFFVRM